jgi:hypothetical protein
LVIGEKVIGQPELIINPSTHVMLSPVINAFLFVSDR